MTIPPIILTTLDSEIDLGIDMVLSSDDDFGEISVYDFLYGIRHRLDNITSLASTIFKDREFMNVGTPTFKWTPLHVAVICGELGVVRWLTQEGADLNPKDHKNWTPLHFATLLGRPKCVELLLEAGADKSCENHLGGTFLDLVRCLEPVEKSDDTLIGLRGEDGNMLTYGDFKKVTGATYVQETHLSLELMWEQWKTDSQPHEYPFFKRFAKRYRDFCDHPPVHQLKQATCNPSPGLGLYAMRGFQVGELVGEYKGLFTDGNALSEYSLSDEGECGVDAKKFRNDMAHANDGFPSVLPVPLRGVAGLSTRDLFVAADNLKAGDELCYNYGFVPYVKAFMPYAELRPKEVRAFIKSDTLNNLMQCFDKVAKRVCTFEEFVKGEKLRYILQTPAVLFTMLLDQSLTNEQGETLVLYALTTGSIPKVVTFPTFVTMPQLVEQCLKMRRLVKKQMPYLLKEYNAWIQSLPARAGIVFTLDAVPKAHGILNMMSRKKDKSETKVFALWNKFKTTQLEEIDAHVTKYAKMAFSECRK